MRPRLPLLAVIMLTALAIAVPALGFAAVNLTPVSEFQNASVYVNTSTTNLTMVGTFDNATVYRSGGANVTLRDHSALVDMGSAPEMGYRDIYLYVKMPSAPFYNVTFDYDLYTGDKSNVLLVDFQPALPRIGVVKGGIKDQAVLGLGTWSALYGEIGGLKPFPQGAHHVEVAAAGSDLVLRVDDRGVAVAPFEQQAYLVIHLMTGDENSYLHGSVSNLVYNGPPVKPAGTEKPTPLPAYNLSGTDLPPAPTVTAVPTVTLPSSDPDTHTETVPKSRLLPEVNFAFAIVAAIVLIGAWAYVYFRYINK